MPLHLFDDGESNVSDREHPIGRCILAQGEYQNGSIGDEFRGNADAHRVLERNSVKRGRVRAIDIFESVTRTLPRCNRPEEQTLGAAIATEASGFDAVAEMITSGAGKTGTNTEADMTIKLYRQREVLRSHKKDERCRLPIAMQHLTRSWPA